MRIKTIISGVLFSSLIFVGCSQNNAITETEVIEVIQPTAISTELSPTSFPTSKPEPTAIPGLLVYPIDTLANSIPWLPLDESKRPTSAYYGFNINKPPFNNQLVREAFAVAVNREIIAEMAEKFYFENARPATSLTPPETIGRELYNAVGINFDPEKGKILLSEAGYSDIEVFPKVTLIVSTRGEAAPGAYFLIAEEIVKMWQDNLGITVEIKVIGDFGKYLEALHADDFSIYQLTWGADFNDPDNFLNAIFHSTAEINFGHFASEEFDALVKSAAGESDPAIRQLLYIEAEQILVEELVGIIPLFHSYFYVGR